MLPIAVALLGGKAMSELEKVIVERLRKDSQAAILDSEPAILELVKTAIEAALTQKRRINTGSWNSEEIDSPSVDAARRIAQAAAHRVAEELTSELMADSQFRALVMQHFVAVMPQAIAARWSTMLDAAAQDTKMAIEAVIREKAGLS